VAKNLMVSTKVWPSNRMARGIEKMKDTHVTAAKRFDGLIAAVTVSVSFCKSSHLWFGLSIVIFEVTALIAKKRLDP
jgi:hypothetical protein